MIYLIIFIAIIYILYELKVFKKIFDLCKKKLLENETIDFIYNEYKENKDTIKEHIEEDIFDVVQDFCRDKLGKDIKLPSISKDTMSDAITLENKDFYKLKSMSGDINIDKCIGGNIRTMSGSIDIGESKVDKAETMSGNLICVQSTSNQLRTMSGSLRITNSTVVKAETLSGIVTTFNSNIETLFCTSDSRLDLREGTKINELYINDSISIGIGKTRNSNKKVIIDLTDRNVTINNIEFLTIKPGEVIINKEMSDNIIVKNGILKIK